MYKFRIVDTLNESFALNEGNRATKRKRNIAMGRALSPEDAEKRRKEQQGTRQDELPGHTSRRSNDPGSNVPPVSGDERGRKKFRGSRLLTVNPDGTTQTNKTKRAQGFLKRDLMAKHGHKLQKKNKEEKPMTNENFEAAFVRANAQIAFTIAEALVSESDSYSTVTPGERISAADRRRLNRPLPPGAKVKTAKKAVDEPETPTVTARPARSARKPSTRRPSN